jgi:hypothetical protein
MYVYITLHRFALSTLRYKFCYIYHSTTTRVCGPNAAINFQEKTLPVSTSVACSIECAQQTSK